MHKLKYKGVYIECEFKSCYSYDNRSAFEDTISGEKFHEGTYRLYAKVINTSSPELDLYLYPVFSGDEIAMFQVAEGIIEYEEYHQLQNLNRIKNYKRKIERLEKEIIDKKYSVY